ncbi:MAG: hypothetical protein D6729_07720, partial [Deltaproteobacteria bacterium]
MRVVSFDRVYRVSSAQRPVAPEAFDALEAQLGHPLPPGYRPWLESFGEGTYCDLLHVVPPDRVQALSERLARRLRARGSAATDAEWVSEADWEALRVFAVSTDGAVLVTGPADRTRLRVLSPEAAHPWWVPDGFFEPLEWRSAGGLVREPPRLRFFEPWARRQRLHLEATDHTVATAHQAILRHLPGEVHVVEQTSRRHVFLAAHLGAIVRLEARPAAKEVVLALDVDAGRLEAAERLAGALAPAGFVERGRCARGRPREIGEGTDCDLLHVVPPDRVQALSERLARR